MAQTDQILSSLLKGDALTPIDALRRFGCFPLGARIHDLKAAGYDIQRKMVEVEDRKRVAEYWMTPEARAQAMARWAA